MGCGSSKGAAVRVGSPQLDAGDCKRVAGLLSQASEPSTRGQALGELVRICRSGRKHAQQVGRDGAGALLQALGLGGPEEGAVLDALRCLSSVCEDGSGAEGIASQEMVADSLVDALRDLCTKKGEALELALNVTLQVLVFSPSSDLSLAMMNKGLAKTLRKVISVPKRLDKEKECKAMKIIIRACTSTDNATKAVNDGFLDELVKWVASEDVMGSDIQLKALETITTLSELGCTDFAKFEEAFKALGKLCPSDGAADVFGGHTADKVGWGDIKGSRQQLEALRALTALAKNPDAEMLLVEEMILPGIIAIVSEEGEGNPAQLQALKLLNRATDHQDSKQAGARDLRLHLAISGCVPLIISIVSDDKGHYSQDFRHEAAEILKHIADNSATATAFACAEYIRPLIVMFEDQTLDESFRQPALYCLMCLCTWSNSFHPSFCKVLRKVMLACEVHKSLYGYVNKPGKFMVLSCFGVMHLVGSSDVEEHIEMVARCKAAVGATVGLFKSVLDRKGPVGRRLDVLTHVMAKICALTHFHESHKTELVLMDCLSLLERTLRERVPEVPVDRVCMTILHLLEDPGAEEWKKQHSVDPDPGTITHILQKHLADISLSDKAKREVAVLSNALGVYADIPDVAETRSQTSDHSGSFQEGSKNVYKAGKKSTLSSSSSWASASNRSINARIENGLNHPDGPIKDHTKYKVPSSSVSTVSTAVQSKEMEKMGGVRASFERADSNHSNLVRSSSSRAIADESPVPLLGEKFKYHAFLTHDWGIDEFGRNNHERVAKLNDYLKKRGLITWFDADRMVGNVVDQMVRGIDDSAAVVVCITQRYVGKVRGTDSADNCKKEFHYAEQRKTAHLMIPVVMERRMMNPREWAGGVGMVLGGMLYQQLHEDENFDAYCELIYKEVCAVSEVAMQHA